MEEHALVVVIVVLVCDLLLAVCVAFPQLLVHHFLDLRTQMHTRSGKGTTVLQVTLRDRPLVSQARGGF